MILRIVEWWKGLRNPPAVVIREAGQLTPRPVVCVSACGRGGAQTVYTFDDADASVRHAKATMYGCGLAEIMRRRLVDQRVTSTRR